MPEAVIERIADGMHQALAAARGDDGIPVALLESLRNAWEKGFAYAR